MRRRTDPYLWLLAALAILYIVVFTGLAWDFHAGMRTHRSDLGQIDQSIWNSSRGRFLAQTDNGYEATRLTDHVEPILILVSPIYWLWDDVRALLLLQVVAAASGVFPLYFLALRRFAVLLPTHARQQIWQIEPLRQLTRPLALALGVAYLLAPQFQSAVLTEFHAAPLAAPFILWAFWAVDARRWGYFLAAALLTALVKEEIALLAAGLGAWAIWRAWWDGRRRGESEQPHAAAQFVAQEAQPAPKPLIVKQASPRAPDPVRQRSRSNGIVAGSLVLCLSLLWFYLATFVIVPAYAAQVYGTTESTYFQRYGALGDSSTDILKSIVTRPDLVWQIASEPARVAYLIGFLVAFAWFPLLGVELLLLALPVLLANLLSAYPAQYYGEFHYSAPLIPYVAVAAAYGLGRLWRWLARRLDRTSPAFQHLPAAGAGTMAAVSVVQNARTAIMPVVSIGLVAWTLVWAGGNYLAQGRGPLAARYDPTPVTAHHRLLGRFTAQIPADAAVTATAAVHPHVSHRRYVYQFPLGLDAPVPAEWALIDVTTNTDMAPGDLKAQVDAMLAGDWGVVDGADGFLLLAKGAEAKSVPAAFYSFVRVAQDVTAGDASVPLQLAAIDVQDWPRWRQTRLVAEWRVGAGFDAQTTGPWLEVVTPQQEVVMTLNSTAPPALVWYPPARWQPGDVVRVTTLPLSLPPVAGIRAAGAASQPAAIFHRQADGRLVRVPVIVASEASPSDALSKAGFGPLLSSITAVQMPDGAMPALRAYVAGRRYAPGSAIDLWLQWELDAWPTNLAAFVHLRRNGETVAQADGPPAFFGSAQPATDANGPFISDWRQLSVPAESLSSDEWTLAVGLYDPLTGQRVPLGAGDELVLGPLKMSTTPVPDQSCALIPATCATQPR